jgi:hypothetical protein
VPERDWSPVAGVDLLAFSIRLGSAPAAGRRPTHP